MFARWTAQAIRDGYHGVRMIAKMPVLAAVVVASLGVGIGVNTVVFSWIQSRVLRPLPGVEAGRTVHLIEPRGETGSYPGTSWLEYLDLKDRLPSFQDVIASRIVPLNVGQPDRAERTTGTLVSENYFSALGLRPSLGRLIGPADHNGPRAASDPVIVISHGYWQSRLGGAPDVVGQTLRVNDRPLTIVGVTRPEFQGTMMGLVVDLFVPATLAPTLFDGTRELDARGMRAYSAIGRLQPRATRAQAQGDLDAAMRQFAHDYPETNAKVTGEVLPLWQAPRGPQRFIASALAVLQAVMLLVLLAVCGNTANLVLARASTRQQEIGVRLALGAERWRIVSLLLTESLILAILGAVLGSLIAVWGTDALRAVPMPTPGGMSIRFQTDVDWITFAFAALLGIGSGVVFGLAPALQLSRVEPQGSLRGGTQSAGRSGMRDVLMIVEVALALVVLVVAGLFLKSFNETRSTDPGFRREGVLLATYDLRGRVRTIEPAVASSFADRLLERVRALPAVENAAIASAVPLDIHGMPARAFTLDGRERADGSRDEALTNTVSPGYFATMGIPLLAGVDFAPLNDVSAAPQAIVNEEFVRRYVGNAEPLGRRIESAGRSYTIVGVVKNSLYNSYGEPPTAFIYLSYRDRPSPVGEVHVRARTTSETTLAADVRRIVRDLDPTLPVYNVRTLNEHVETNLVFRRVPARMFVVLGPLLLGLAAIGIYAVVAYTVSLRKLEIGMRLALGATHQRVVVQLISQTLRIITFGAIAGWILAWMIKRTVAGEAPMDLPIFLGVPALLMLVATLASWVPAARAARIDPIATLRQQ